MTQVFSFNDLARSLLDAKDRAADRAFRSQLPGLLLRLMYYEEMPSDVVARLVPLFRAYSSDIRVVRLLFYICAAHATTGCAGTPTLVGAEGGLASSLVIRPELSTLQTIFAEAQHAVQSSTSNADLAVRRASLYLMAAVARSHEAAKKEMIASMERLVDATENSSENWELQHSVFAAVRLSGAPGGSTAFGAAAFAGVGSPDPVGARHALALVAEVAVKDPLLVVTELSSPLAKAMQGYDPYGGSSTVSSNSSSSSTGTSASTNTPTAPTTPTTTTTQPSPINLQDPWARSHLARACAAVVHSDQGSCDVGRGGAPFWQALVTLATLDASDMVRFAALEALTGVSHASTGTTSREGTFRHQQRRSRAWRVLEAQAETLVLVPGAKRPLDGPPESSQNTMKLIEVIGRLLVLALRKTESAARFTVAVAVTGSLAESCMFSPSSGPVKESRAAVDRVMTVLARELSSLVESPLHPSQRGACIEALLYFQACGYETTMNPAKLMNMRGSSRSAPQQQSSNAMLRCHASLQESLLAAILKCARARPKQATMFLRYASGIVAIAPASMNPNKAVELWDALCSSSFSTTAPSTSSLTVDEGKAAALSAALETLGSSAAAQTSSNFDILTAAREDAGWSAFVSIAAWWLGEHANDLCNEHVGRTSIAWTLPKKRTKSDQKVNVDEGNEKNEEDDYEGDDDDDEHGPTPEQKSTRTSTSRIKDPIQLEAAVRRQASRNPALTRVISALHEIVLTGPWTLRAAAARALGKIAVRSGEPFRMQCYIILNTCLMAGGGTHDALGLRAVVRPALEALDAIYATLHVLEDELYPKYKENNDGVDFPPEIEESLTRRVAWLTNLVESTVCSVPPSKYSILGTRASKHLNHIMEAPMDRGLGDISELGRVGGRGGGGGGGPGSHRFAADNLTANVGSDRNKEVEDILSFGGTEPGFDVDKLFTSRSEQSVDGTTAAGVLTAVGAEEPEDRLKGLDDAFKSLDTYDYGGKSAFEDDTRDFEYREKEEWTGEQRGMESLKGEDIQMQREEQEEDRQQQFRQQQDGGGGTGRMLGKGTMLHTFIADPSHPEELSIFEGDAVEVVEEADGWFLVCDPSGSRGLVPATYVRVDQLFGNSSNYASSNVNGQSSSVWGIAEPAVSMSLSFDESQGASEGLGLQHGTVWADFPTPRTATSSPRRGGATSPTRFSPGPGGNPFGDIKGHRRSHSRTLSGGSDAMSWGSIPTTPSQIEGPERSIAVGFVAEMEGELTVEPGDVVKVHSEVGGWARVLRVADRASGLVPSWAVGGGN